MLAKRLQWTAILGAIMLCAPASWAERASYRGAHAIPKTVEGRFCHIEVAHTHTYPPDESLGPQFVESAPNRFEFVGDPKDFRFKGPSQSYYGAHPMRVVGDLDEPSAVCARSAKHSHLQAPLDPEAYEERDGTYYFASYTEAKRAARRTRRSARSQRRSAPARVSKSNIDRQRPTAKPVSPAPKPKAKTGAKADPHRSWMKR